MRTHSLHVAISRSVLVCSLVAVVTGHAAPALAAAPDEFRAMASSRFEWPNKDLNTCKAFIDTLMQKLHDNNFNAVIMQMRGQCDTLYPSPYEPWSPILSTDGKAPAGWGSFDPMAYAINKAHEKGLEFHAYLNANVVWQSGTPDYCDKDAQPIPHIYWSHCDITEPTKRDWLCCDSSGNPVGFTSEYVWVAPGVPSFQAYWRKQIMYVVEYYDGSDPVNRPAVDGVHFDRARLPSNAYSYDPISQSRRLGGGNPAGLAFGDWTSDQITRMLTDLYAQVNEYTENLSPTHHRVKVSSAPLGLYLQERYPGYPSYYLYGRSVCFQDAQAWLAAGAQDFICPQIYWEDPPYQTTTPYFSDVLPDWLNHNAGRHVYPYCNVSATGPGLVDENTVMRSMVSQIGQGNAPGSTIWVYNSFNNNNLWSYFYGTGKPYAEPASTPAMPWKDNPTDAIILGTVTDGADPITDVHVTRNGSTYTALSSEDGLYSFLKVPPGTYTLTYSKTGVVGTTRQVTVTAGQVLRVAEVVLNTNAPPVITNVAATGVTNVAATITWTTNTDATSQVEYGTTTSYGSTTPLDSTAVKSHSVALSGLTANTLYHYRVTSSNSFGSTTSGDYTFTTLGPPSISNVATSGLTSSSVTITWTTNAASTSQVFYGLTAGYGSSSPLDSTNVTSHSVALSGLTASTTYHYKVASTNTYGSAESVDATFTTPAVTPEIVIDNVDAACTRTGSWSTGSVATVPKVGTNYQFTAGTGSTSSTTATCRWTPTIGAPGNYDVYVFYQIGANRSPSAPYTVVYNGGSLTSTQNQYSTIPEQGGWFLVGQNLPFAAGTSGYVQVANNSTSTNYVSADAAKFVRVDTQAPTVPSNVNASAAFATSIQLSWTASTDDIAVTGYKVFRNGSQVGTSATNSYTDTGLIANTSYSYTVLAYDAASNESAQSSPAVAKVTLSAPPSSANVTCNRTANTWYVTPGFTFTAVGGFGAGTVSKYKYAWGSSATHTWTGSEAEWSSGTLGLNAAPGSNYLHVRGYNSDNVANGTLDLGPYLYDNGGPSNPIVIDDGVYTSVFGSLHATWSASDPQSGVKKYEYRILEDGGAVIRDWTDVGAATSVTAVGLILAPRETYYIDVRATNNADLVSQIGQSDGILIFPYDVNNNSKVDDTDFGFFGDCGLGADVPYPVALSCGRFDSNGDGDVDMDDFGAFQNCYTGAGAIDPACLE